MEGSSEVTPFDFSKVTSLTQFKIAMITNSAINICVTTVLYLFVIWFEKFKSAVEPTLANQIMASLCWLNIANNFLGTLTEILVSLNGPFCEIVCLSHLIWRSSMILEIFNMMIAITLAKYVSLFWKINPVGSNAKFWRFFINLSTLSGNPRSFLCRGNFVKSLLFVIWITRKVGLFCLFFQDRFSRNQSFSSCPDGRQ